jgi:UDP-GlcNAc:undecaprenyl-phosphate GlcNAc-1-phosphate transferase
MLRYLLPFGVALVVSLILTPGVIVAARRAGFMVQPREDRWHTKPTALLGGVGIFIAFSVAFWVFLPGWQPRPRLGLWEVILWTDPLKAPAGSVLPWLFGCAAAMFVIGLADDLRPLRPQLKFILQLLVAIVAVIIGVQVKIIPWAIVAIPLTLFWLAGITNAVNILDNMDGLAPGTAFIAAFFLTFFAHLGGNPTVALAAAVLAGAVLGFLPYNFNPARIFMGDCGSLFLGFTLAALAIVGTWQNVTHLVLTLLIPLAVLVVPIFDTALVSFERSRAGRSIAQGGRDHSSHRLVFLGLSERRAVAVLLTISFLFGLGALLLVEYAGLFASLTVLAIMSVPLVFFGVFLSGVRVYSDKPARRINRRSPVGLLILHKKQLLQISVDLLLVTAAYFAAYQLRFEGRTETILHLFTKSAPLVIGAKLITFTVFGLYRGQWRYASIHDLIRVSQAVVVASLVSLGLVIVTWHFAGFSRAVFIIDLVLCLMLVGGSRVLLRVYVEYFRRLGSNHQDEPVLIMGAGDGGEMLLRELNNNDTFRFKVVGFIDDDLKKKGQTIHGVPVLGARGEIPELVKKRGVKRIFIAILSEPPGQFTDLIESCQHQGVACHRIQPILDLEATLRGSGVGDPDADGA